MMGMRIASLNYEEDRECRGSSVRDEKQISTYILSFQVAEKLLRIHQGSWKITGNQIVLQLKDLEQDLVIDIESGKISYGTVTIPFANRYSAAQGVMSLVQELCSDLNIPPKEAVNDLDFLFKVFVKLVEVFHARCDLRILPGNADGEWEIRLGEEGPSGWLSADNIAENRFGEKMDISVWENLRAEKVATYLFGFNRFCKNFQCPMR